jgi:hypothetical protein
VINLITKGFTPKQVPFGFNLLTSLLQDSLGGAAQTLLIVTISPSKYDVEATMSTLEFAEQTGRIKNRDGVLTIKQAVADQTEAEQIFDFDVQASKNKIAKAVGMIKMSDL